MKPNWNLHKDCKEYHGHEPSIEYCKLCTQHWSFRAATWAVVASAIVLVPIALLVASFVGLYTQFKKYAY